MRWRGAVLAIALAACAPEIATPAEQARAADRADADRIAAVIATLPGVAAAHAEVARDRATAPRAAIVILAAADADAAALAAAGRALAGAVGISSPRVDVTIARTPAVATATLAQVGPFTVAASSASALRATLVALLLAIAAAAGVVAASQRRRGNRPQ